MPSETPIDHRLIASQSALDEVAKLLAKDRAPVAIDAERASGYRYHQRAYLVQIHHESQGTWLIDPIAINETNQLASALSNREWVLHAATQDLPCLRELGLKPDALFDTELAGRLLGMPRVALAVMLENFVGVKLKKQHSAADWSKRPLPQRWLDYAALDVAYLLELRNKVQAELSTSGKLDWALEEFQSLLSFQGPPKREEPWRRISGLHHVTDPLGRAIARALWLARDQIAANLDIAPGRVLSDTSIVATALKATPTRLELSAIAGFDKPLAQQHLDAWWAAIEPELANPTHRQPHPRAPKRKPEPEWPQDTSEEAGLRLVNAKAALAQLSKELATPSENLISVSALKTAAAIEPTALTKDVWLKILKDSGARGWQIQLVEAPLYAAIKKPALDPMVAGVTDQ